MQRFPAIAWIDTLRQVTAATVVTMPFDPVSLDTGIELFRAAVRHRVAGGGRVFLIGNGGSLAIASHIATDFALFCDWPSLALTDAVALTSHTNDFGPDSNFSKQLDLLHINARDVLIGLSCSGYSRNICDAIQLAETAGAYPITFTGFDANNRLRRLGRLNFYVPAQEYGFVQLAHESLLHAACDLERGWEQ